MESYGEWITARQLLRQSPSIKAWEIEIESIFRGDRELLLEDIGAAEYTESLMRSSVDYSASRAFFRVALDRVISAWQPTVIDRELEVTYTFDLIASYTPTLGLSKVLEFLDRHACLSPGNEGHKGISPLIVKALLAAQEYYQGPPGVPVPPIFQAYTGFLLDCIEDGRYARYALNRLVVTGVWGLNDPKLIECIRETPESVGGLVALWLGSTNEVAISRNLSILYGHCLKLGLTSFLEALDENGAALVLSDDLQPRIVHLGRHIFLDLSYLDSVALTVYRKGFLDPLLEDPRRAGKAVSELIRCKLIEVSSNIAKAAIENYRESAMLPLLELVDKTSSLMVKQEMLQGVWGHCRALDSVKQELDYCIILNELLSRFEGGIHFGFVSGHEQIFLSFKDVHIPLEPGMDREQLISWRLFEQLAVQEEVVMP